MIAIWDALYLEGHLAAGRTRPLLVSCAARGGRNHERGVFVVKVPGLPEVTPSLCWRELMGHLLARALGVRVPEPVVVSVSPEFVTATRHDLSRLNLSLMAGLAFGCRHLVSLANVTHTTTNAPERLVEAARIYAVDMLLQNHDRTVSHPNCAVDKEGLVAFDFEQSFGFLYLIGPQPEPWQISQMGDLPRTHLFWKALRGHVVDWEDTLVSLGHLDEYKLEQIVSVIPDDWEEPGHRETVVNHVRGVRSNLEQFRHELKASLV